MKKNLWIFFKNWKEREKNEGKRGKRKWYMNILLVEQHVREFEILFCLDNAVFSFRYLSDKC